MSTGSSSAIATIVAALALAGCGSSAGTGGTDSTDSTGSAGSHAAVGSLESSAPASPSCQSQALAWKNGGGASHLNPIVSDLSAIQNAFAGSDRSPAALQAAATSLQSDVHAAEAALPPACIPGMRQAYGLALTDYSKAAGDFQDTASEQRSGNDSVALADAQAGTNAMGAGDTEISAAYADLSSFVSSES